MEPIQEGDAPSSQPSSDLPKFPSPNISANTAQSKTLVRRAKGKQRLTAEALLSPTDFQPGSSATPLMAESDISRFVDYGITPAPSAESAAAAHSRHNANEARLTQHIAELNSRLTESTESAQPAASTLQIPPPRQISTDKRLKSLSDVVHALDTKVSSLTSLFKSYTARSDHLRTRDGTPDSSSSCGEGSLTHAGTKRS
ncbi:hypothetical protein C0992_011261, partial [Termitomyces sp. T32_za158]